MRKPINLSIPEQLIKDVDNIIKHSGGVFNSRSHFVELAIRERLKGLDSEIEIQSTQS